LLANVRAKKILKAVPGTNQRLGAIIGLDYGVVVGGGDGYVRLFDNTQHVSGQVRLDGGVAALSLSPDKLELLAGTNNGSIVRINLESMQFITLSESHTRSVVAVSFAPGQSDKFATASKDGTIRVWEAGEYMVVATARARPDQDRAQSLPLCLVFAHVLLSGWTDGKILAHDADSGEHLWFIDKAHVGEVTAISLSNNSRFLLSGGLNGDIRLWELRSRDLISNMKEHTQKITGLAIFQDDSMVLSCSRDRCILRWDLRTERRQFCHTQRMGGINGIALASDQRTILSVGQEKRLTFWDVITPEPVQAQSVDGEHDEALAVAISNDGSLIALGGTAGILYVCRFESGARIFRCAAHVGPLTSLAFSPDDKQIVTTGEDGCIYLWCVFS